MPPPDATPEEIGEFWDTHDLADYWDETHEVEFQVNLKPHKRVNKMRDTIRFGDFVEVNPRLRLEKGKEYPYIEMTDVNPGNAFVYPLKKRVYKGGGSRFQSGDTLFARITPCLENGKIVRCEHVSNGPCFGSTEFFIFRGKPNVSDPTYIFYLALSHLIRDPAVKSMTGASGRQRAILSSVEDIQVPAYSFATQRKIASILSAYDDLIENNTRRIKILEDMAQTLYREWFVHFRFPGHESVSMVESPLGAIPQGWEVKRLGEVAQLYRGRSYRSINLVEHGDGLPFLNLKNINREGGFRTDGLKWYDGEFKETQVASSNDIIMALTDVTQDRKVVARSARVPDLGYEKYVLSMDLLKIEPIELIQMDFLYALLKYSSFPEKLKEYANGTTVLHLSPNHVQSSELVLPPNILRQRYAEVAMSIRQQNDLLEKKNVSLRQTRDLLLPKLISGEIDVSELDIDTGKPQSCAGGERGSLASKK